MEHGWQLCNAIEFLESQGESVGNLLDAVERTLQFRIQTIDKGGRFINSIQGWEAATGAIPQGKTLYDLYEKPQDRDFTRDWSEGSLALGVGPREGVVYFSKVLDFYLDRRPPERLFHPGTPLQTVLDRLEPTKKGTGYPRTSTRTTPGLDYRMNYPHSGKHDFES